MDKGPNKYGQCEWQQPPNWRYWLVNQLGNQLCHFYNNHANKVYKNNFKNAIITIQKRITNYHSRRQGQRILLQTEMSKIHEIYINISPSFEAVYCYICGRRRVADARYRMINLVPVYAMLCVAKSTFYFIKFKCCRGLKVTGRLDSI